MLLKEAVQKNHFSKEEYRSAFSKIITNEPTNILETRALMNVINNNPQMMILPTDIEGKLVEIVNDSNALIPYLKNLYNVFVENKQFTFPISNVIQDEALELENYNIKLQQVIITSELPNIVAVDGGAKIENIIINQLSNKFADKLEDLIINADGTNGSHYGLAVAGSGVDGAYVEDVDLVSTASLSENDLIQALGYVSKYHDAKVLMSQGTFLTQVFPLMSSSKLVYQEGKTFYIAGHEIILSEKVEAGVIYLADLGYMVGDMIFRFGASEEIRKGISVYGLFTDLGFLPVGSVGAFAKILIGD